MSAADVGKQFVTAYYTTLQTNRESLITFYSESSSLTYGGQEFKGIKEISEKIESFGFQKVSILFYNFYNYLQRSNMLLMILMFN